MNPRSEAPAPRGPAHRRSPAPWAENPNYELYHPRWHRRRVPIFWWLGKLCYIKFITRELTSLAVAYAAVLLLVQIRVLSLGAEAYDRFLEILSSPVVIVLNVLVLLFLVFHTVTWLNLAPKALVVKLGRKRISDAAVIAGHYLAWLAATALLVGYLIWS